MSTNDMTTTTGALEQTPEEIAMWGIDTGVAEVDDFGANYDNAWEAPAWFEEQEAAKEAEAAQPDAWAVTGADAAVWSTESYDAAEAEMSAYYDTVAPDAGDEASI